MKFKGTFIFTILVALICGFAIYDYYQQGESKIKEAEQHRAFPDKNIEDVRTLSLKTSDGEIVLENKDGQWQLTKPVEDKVDAQALYGFVGNFLELPLKLTETEGAINWSQYGLDKPAQKFEVEFSDGKKRTLEFGTIRAFDDSFYVRRDGEEKLYIADVGWHDVIRKSANELRDKNLYPNTAGEPVAFTVKSKGQKTFTFTNIEGKWSLEGQPKFQVDDSAISEFINKIRHLKGDAIIADNKTPADLRKHGLQVPAFDLTVKFEGDDKPWNLQVSSLMMDSKTPSDRAAVVSSSMPAIYELQVAKAQGLKTEVNQFRNKFYPFSFDQGKVRYIRTLKKGEEHETRFAMINDKWELDIENPHLKVDATEIDNFMNEIRGLRVVKFLGRSKWNSKEVRENRIQLLDVLRQEHFVLEWGGEFSEDGQTYYLAKTNQADEVFSVLKSVIDEIANKKLTTENNSAAQKNEEEKK